METRDKTVNNLDDANDILEELEYASSLSNELRGDGLLRWASEHSDDNFAKLKTKKLKKLSELLYRSMNFLKIEKNIIKKSIINIEKIKKFI